MLFLELTLAVIASVLWGLVSISFLSYYIAKQKKEKPLRMITEHVLFTIMVVAVTHFVGVGISSIFG